MKGIEEVGPMLRQEAIRRNMGQAGRTVLLMDGALGLQKMGQLNFPDATQIVDFWHGADHAGKAVEALLAVKTTLCISSSVVALCVACWAMEWRISLRKLGSSAQERTMHKP